MSDSAAPVVVVVPARDEEATVGEVVAAVPRAIEGHPVRVIVVDDGSSDATAERAARVPGVVLVRHDRPRGSAEAVRTGLLAALELSPALVAQLDADGQHDPADLSRLARPVLAGRADLVQAVGDPAAAAPARRAVDALASALARRRIRDAADGMRAIAASAVPALLPLPGSRFPHAQTRMAAHALGLRVRVVVCDVAPRRHGTTSTPSGLALVVPAAWTLLRRRMALGVRPAGASAWRVSARACAAPRWRTPRS